MKFKYTILTGWTLILAAFAVALWFYPQLPDPVPTHWDATGHINGYTPKPWGVIIMPLVMTGIWLLLWILPYISPKGFRLDSFLPVYGIISFAILAVLFLMNMVTLLAARGDHLPIQRLLPAILGVLLLITGNYLGKIRKNFFVGIRTPWTLASDEVWMRTHRLGGWLFAAGGLIITVAVTIAPVGLIPGILITVIGVAVLGSVGASYFIYRSVEGFNGDNNDDQ